MKNNKSKDSFYKNMKLNYEFYNTDALTLAKKLLGKIIVRNINGKKVKCMITETEAYVGPEDKACHAYNNKKTKRTKVMFKKAGISYIYLIYGMYHCFNIVCGDVGKPEAVLIRSVKPINGIKVIKKNRDIKSNKLYDLTNGPGKLCQAMSIDMSFNDYNLVEGDIFYLEENKEIYDFNMSSSPRINIDYAKDYKNKPWRFFIKDSSFLSK
ncbi:MAG: DNA-3-methyladenine glycosylase [Candidatus Woesearchaeota archaeon]